MKKIFIVLVLFCVVVTGCSCTKTGEYKFDSIVTIVANEEKTYSCTDENKTDNPLIKSNCSTYENVIMELTKDDKLITKKEDGTKISEVWYKIEDGKLFTKINENSDYEEIAEYKKNVITIDLNGVKIIFKK